MSGKRYSRDVLGSLKLQPGTGTLGMSWEVPDCSLGLLRCGTLGMSGKGYTGMSLKVPDCSLGLL